MGVNEFPPDFMLVQAYSLEMCQTFHRRVLFRFRKFNSKIVADGQLKDLILVVTEKAL